MIPEVPVLPWFLHNDVGGLLDEVEAHCHWHNEGEPNHHGMVRRIGNPPFRVSVAGNPLGNANNAHRNQENSTNVGFAQPAQYATERDDITPRHNHLTVVVDPQQKARDEGIEQEDIQHGCGLYAAVIILWGVKWVTKDLKLSIDNEEV